MRNGILSAIVSLSVVLSLGSVQPAAAQFYTQHNLVSDGLVPADHPDPNMVNAWALVSGPTTPWWIADNGSGRTTLYNVGTGAIQAIFTVPGAGGQQGTPTGVVFNGGTGFVVTNSGGTSPARFIFAAEDGTISGFRGAPLVIAVDNSASGAVYKGLAIASTTTGDFLYATNFHAGTVDVFNSTFHPVTMLTDAFTDPDLPAGYAPFGNLLRRVASKGLLNSPWGLALAPADFGFFSGDLLVGNFGNGRIHAFDPTQLTGQSEFQRRGPLHSADGSPIAVDGLWAIAFGSGGAANGPTNTLFFTAGPGGEHHGLFGTLVVAASPDGH